MHYRKKKYYGELVATAHQKIKHPFVYFQMSPKEAHLIFLRHMSGLPYDQIGKVLGITRERVRQIEAKFLENFTNYLFDTYKEQIKNEDALLPKKDENAS